MAILTTNLSLTGVNLAGAEFSPPNGSYYQYPTQAEIDYEAFKGMNVIRVPVEWERLQPNLGGALDTGQLEKLDAVVSEAAKDGVKVIIDLHNYGKYNGNLVGEGFVTNTQFADFWGKMAVHYGTATNVIYGLMNEPAQKDATATSGSTGAQDWLNSINAAIQAIRYTTILGTQSPTVVNNQEILVSGINYDGAWTWVGSPNDTVISKGIVDPGNNYALEVHQYFDSDGSGTSDTVSTGSNGSTTNNNIGVDRLSAITTWAQQNGQKLFLGEVGVPYQQNPNNDPNIAAQNQSSLSALQNALSYINTNAGVWQGFTYWAAGPLWGNYVYSSEPKTNPGNTSNDGYDDAPQQTVLDNFAQSSATVCFCTGTRILTTRGDVVVEHLAAGDLAVTASGERRPVRWIGHRTVDLRRHPRPEEACPVRVAAHAFSDNRPARDLTVSPGHALCLDVLGEVLVPASALVNGSTVQRLDVDEVTYWHVELDSHDVLLAENMPAESYLDMGNRSFFAGTSVVDLDAAPDADPAARSHADFCRPFHASGSLIEAVRAQMRRRAEDSGWTVVQEELKLHAFADGRRLEPVVRGLVARFHVPAGTEELRVVSAAARPIDTTGEPDHRRLGLCVGAMRIEDGFGPGRDVALDDPRLNEGFHHCEDGLRRWTTGDAVLPSALWASCEDDFYLTLTMAGPQLPRWRNGTETEWMTVRATAA